MKISQILIFAFLLVLPGLLFAKNDLRDSAAASERWLKVVDSGKFDKSWDGASILLKVKFPKASWVAYLNGIRKPLGGFKSREVIDQRTAENPPNMPSGKYIVMVYRSVFSKQDNVTEVVVLRLSDRGDWQVLTYQLTYG